jgi:integrase
MKSPKSPAPVRKPKAWPLVIRSGDCEVKIYHTPTTVRGQSYDSYTLSYFANGKRIRSRFSDFATAKLKAELIAEQKAQGALGAAALSAKDRLAIENALTELAKVVGCGEATPAHLAQVVIDWATAAAGLPAGTQLVEAVKYYAARHPANMRRLSVKEAVEEFIADRKSAKSSAIHLRDLGVRLGQFSRAFLMDLHLVAAPDVQQWVYGLTREHDQQPASNRTKENMLRQIVSLFNFARRQKWVTAELAAEIGDIPVPKSAHSAVTIYTAAEIAGMLSAAEPELVPALAISAFAGLRLAEVARLDWKEIRLAERLIVIEAAKAKTAARRLVPISDNLAAWLTPHFRKFGSVNPAEESTGGNVGHSLGLRFQRAAARAQVTWQRNALRHSYISYRVADLKNVNAVALECGNSAAIIFSNYRALATDQEAKDWFNVRPPAAAAGTNITTLHQTKAA